ATTVPPGPPPPHAPPDEAPPADGLFEAGGLREAALAEARQAPIERWMTFLDQHQIPLVRRNWAGPARISGPAGTGKTVVGLHRAAYLARRTPKKVLYVTFANNLPRVQGTFLAAMAPAVADRVHFHSLHSWAHGFLNERGVATHLHGDKALTAFSLAWKNVGRDGPLADVDPGSQYWREEIDHVIKGRGITTLDQYAAVPRRGRRTRLGRALREAVWRLHEEYERLRADRRVHDFNDILALALGETRRETFSSPYGAVVVDEVQDLTLVGIRLLHSLTGDAPNGLLLIGDGQQAVYPGGFRLSEAGIDIRGDRGQVLRTNYRNTRQVIEAALAVVADDAFEDIDELRTPGRRDVDLIHHDGGVVRVSRPTAADHDRAFLAALHERASDGGWAGIAVLCPTRRAVGDYQRLLRGAHIPTCLLDHYKGTPVDAVKLGTYRRAKGLEFAHVLLPRHDVLLHETTPDADVTHERRELARRQLFVAMTRARDTLWLGTVAPPP
uniref:UvrD-helicase domain-containing protein n=1 Tax=Streptomyces sp. SBT349 TaxID=1580539 RepID=UPI00066DAF93